MDLPGSFRAGDGDSVEVHITDMCTGGAFLETDVVPDFGTQIMLTIGLPKGGIEAKATVRWHKPGGMGVQFGLLGAKETYALTEHLADLDPMPDSRMF